MKPDSLTPCHLLTKLPPEIRLAIYEFVLTQHGPITLTHSSPSTHPSSSSSSSSKLLLRTNPLPLGPLTSLNLLLTNRQIRTEALPVFTSCNQLVIIAPVLGQGIHFLPLHGRGGSGDGDGRLLDSAAHVTDLWRKWAAGGKKKMKVDVHIGTWYTWWEEASTRAVGEVLTRFFEPCVHNPSTSSSSSSSSGKNEDDNEGNKNPPITLRLTINWSAIPSTHSTFEAELWLWDLQGSRSRVREKIQREREWVVELMMMTTGQERGCLMENIERCERMVDEVFRDLEMK